MAAGTWGATQTITVAARGNGVAVQPVMDLLDHVAIGYEASPRPDPAVADIAFLEAAVAVTQHAGPAVLFAPVTPDLLLQPGFDASALARAMGALPAEIAWTVPNHCDPVEQDECVQRLKELRAAGFRLAVDDARLTNLSRSLVAQLQPDFVFLDPLMTKRLHDDVAKAELAAMVSFVTRLKGRLIARGMESSEDATAVSSLGLSYGIGRHLAAPVVLDAEVALPGDEVVSPAWFRGRDVRVFEERGAALHAPFVLTALPVHDGMTVDERTFARLLGEAARALQAEHDAERILRMAAEVVLQVMPIDRLAIFEADWERHCLVPRVAAGIGMEGIAGMENSMNEGITGWAFSNGVSYRCEDTDRHPAAATIPGTERVEESLLVIPLIAGDHRIGVLDVWRNGLDSFTDEELERATAIGYILAAAWRNAALYAELERRAFTDALTGLLNIRWWNEIAPREAAQSIRTNSQIGVLLVDLDDFKRINDVAGHAAGDAALRSVARALRMVTRQGDAAVRYGGEEFLLMLADSGPEGALRVAEAVQAALADLPPPAPNLPRVRASIGIALYPHHGRNLDDVARAADLAMYGAKRSGGDSVAMAPEAPAA